MEEPLMEKVLVTGAGGFIGGHLTEKLLSLGVKVTALDIQPLVPWRLSDLAHRTGFAYHHGDVTTQEFVDWASAQRFNEIFHLAAVVGVENYCRDPLKTIDVNVLGTRNVLKAAASNKTKILYASTSEVYGVNPKVPWSEDSERVLGSTRIDRWAYSTSKALSEHMLFAARNAYHVPFAIVRYFNVYGPKQEPIFVIPAMIRQVIQDKPPRVYDSGTQTRCFTFIQDAIEATILASESGLAEGQAFNIGNDREITVLELAKLITSLVGKEKLLLPDFVQTSRIYDSYEDIPRRVPDVTKARTLLGWRALTPLEQGLRLTIDAFRNDPANRA